VYVCGLHACKPRGVQEEKWDDHLIHHNQNNNNHSSFFFLLINKIKAEYIKRHNVRYLQQSTWIIYSYWSLTSLKIKTTHCYHEVHLCTINTCYFLPINTITVFFGLCFLCAFIEFQITKTTFLYYFIWADWFIICYY